MPETLDETNANWLMRFADGHIENVPKSPMNRLLYEHNLWGLLRSGDEVLVCPETDDRPRVEVVPSDDATEYTITVGDYDSIHLGPHQKSRLIEALAEGKEREGSMARPLIRLYDSIRDGQVRRRLTDHIARQPPFAGAVEVTENGWLIKDHLLLTWEGEFHHPGTTSKTRSGSVVQPGSARSAYNISVNRLRDDAAREVEFDGQKYRLSDAEMGFIARAIWGVQNAPSWE